MCCFNPDKHSFRNFDMDDGLQGNQFEIRPENAGGCCKGKDGTLYFGGPNGLNVFHPQNLTFDTTTSPVVITRFILFDKTIPGKQEAQKIILNHDENFFSLEFAALSYRNTSKNLYAYQLVGVDKGWIYSGTRRLASYTNISPGNYEFRVKTANNDGVWNEKGVSVKIIILPAWYQTWWFYVLCVLITGLIIYSLFQYRLNQKLRVLQIRNRLHRDLHDDLGATLSSVKAYSEILKDNPDTPLIAELIKENAGEMIDQLEVITWATNPQFDSMNNIISKMQQYAVPLLHAKQIQYNFSPDGIALSEQVQGEIRQNLLLIFKEAINNIVKYSSARNCNVHLYTEKSKFILKIQDDGVGIGGTVKGSGNGISNMKKRAEQLGGFLKIQTSPDNGTSIRVSIPYPFRIPNK